MGLRAFICLIFFTLTYTLEVQAQDTMYFTHHDVVNTARKQSLQAFRVKNMYIAQYWSFRSYKASRRPILWLNTSPVDYSNRISKYYDFAQNTDRYVETNNLISNVRLSVDQKIPWTGGSIYIESMAERYQNLLFDTLPASFSTNPILSLGFTQSLSMYNQLKWESKLKPKEFERAQKEYLLNVESLSIRALGYFFDLARAQIDMSIAETNLENNTSLYEMALKRFQTNEISEDELLDLELNKLNAEITHAKGKLDLQQVQQALNSFLSLPENTIIICHIPKEMPIDEISYDLASENARINNPNLMKYEEQLISADRDVAYRRSQTGLSGTLTANYGLTGNNADLAKAYQSPGDYQRLAITFSLPLVDWGQRKGQYLMAKSNREVIQAEVEQARIDFQQDLYRKVVQFNLQKKRVVSSARADEIALKAYELTSRRFTDGEVNVLKLNSARSSRDKAKRAYLQTVREYWIYYYEIRRACLFDFEKNISFSEDFERMINEL